VAASDTQITMRRVKPDEAETLLNLSKQTFFDAFEAQNNPKDFKLYCDEAFTLDKISGELANPNSQFYFGVILGYIKLNFADAQIEFKETDALEIERVYVLQQHQGKQIGKAMLNFVFEIAYREKLRYVWLGVWESNVSAIRFYERHGFVKHSSHYFMLGNDKQTDILMRRTIAQAL
jgi:ribosomal protein S18 acetylase RimI-like enzyme